MGLPAHRVEHPGAVLIRWADCRRGLHARGEGRETGACAGRDRGLAADYSTERPRSGLHDQTPAISARALHTAIACHAARDERPARRAIAQSAPTGVIPKRAWVAAG